MKKIWLLLMFIAVIAIIVFFILIIQKSEEVLLVDGEEIPMTTCVKLNRVTLIGKEGCPHCAIAESRLKELEQELGMEFKYYDLARGEDAQEVKEFNLIVQFVPSVIIDCKVYVGVRDKEQYKKYIQNIS